MKSIYLTLMLLCSFNTERRETCWVADKGVGGLAYSGKIMNPIPLPPCIDRIRCRIEELTGIRYDCALINLYPDGDCAVIVWFKVKNHNIYQT